VSSDVGDTKPNLNGPEAIQKFRQILLALVERPARSSAPGETLSVEDQLVGKYAGLLPVLELPANAGFVTTALVGVRALQAGQLQVANHIYEEVNFGTSNVTALAYVMQGVLVFVLFVVLLSVVSFLLFLVVAVTSFHEANPSALFTKDLFMSELTKVAIASLFGCFGGVVSLLTRLPEFEMLKGRSRTFLRALGGTQPIIGGIFALVVGALFSAKIINITVGGASDLSTWFYVVIGFLAGFSERFTRNLLNVAESHLGGPTGP
jgi:hypothetical protein